MVQLTVDLKNTGDAIKRINAVNNGPVGGKIRSFGNAAKYEALEIPYARNHDASFYAGYGGEHTVDVHRIFKNFDADENDPKSYVFGPTDQYIAETVDVGTKVFYRLGASIEHEYKEGTIPPRDFHKWARICEHIIRHYTEGWADGFNYDIEYWEIWNEPDFAAMDEYKINPCWQGSFREFIDFYEVVSKHLKATFPHLKIGGPAFCESWKKPNHTEFLNAVKERGMPLDFYSFHGYFGNPDCVISLGDSAVATIGEAGIENMPELFLNEYNYIISFKGDEFKRSIQTMKGLKGSSFIAGCMAACQVSHIDMLMYYDARPSHYNGLFNSIYEELKTYFVFEMARDLRRLGTWVRSPYRTGDILTLSATNGKESAIMITNYKNVDELPNTQVELTIENAPENGARVEYYLLDADNNNVLVKEEAYNSASFTLNLDMKLFDTYLIKINAL